MTRKFSRVREISYLAIGRGRHEWRGRKTMNTGMGNFLPCAFQRDEEEVPSEMTKNR